MLCNQKHDLFRKYRRGLILYDHYSKFNKDFSLIIKKCKINYFRNKFHSCANDIKKTWETINSVIGGKRRQGLSEIIKEGLHYTSNTDMAKCFNNYFESVASISEVIYHLLIYLQYFIRRIGRLFQLNMNLPLF